MHLGLIAELQRIKRRTRVRLVPVLLLATVITGAIGYKIGTKKQIHDAEVILALSEGAMTAHRAVPAEQLREYVTSVLLPDSKLIELIERRDLFPLRKRAGDEYAIGELRSNLEIAVWKNSFVYYDDEDETAQKSARIGITYNDTDPDRAYAIAHDLAAIAIASHDADREKVAAAVAAEVELMRRTVEDQLGDITATIAIKRHALAEAGAKGDSSEAAALSLDLAKLTHDRVRLETHLGQIAASPDARAAQLAASGLDMTLAVVEERRPERSPHSVFVLIMVIVVIGTCAVVGSALLLGAFDARVHDTDDVERLGLPVLGHVPGFPGDHVGSLHARRVERRRVPSFLRWRSHR